MLRSRRCRKTYVQKQTPKLEYRQNVAEYRRIPVEYRWNTGGIPAVRSPEILPDLTLHVYTCLFLRAWGKHCRGRGERKVVVGGKLEGLQVKTVLLILLSREPLVFWYSSLVPCSVAPTLPAHWPPRSSCWRPGPVALWYMPEHIGLRVREEAVIGLHRWEDDPTRFAEQGFSGLTFSWNCRGLRNTGLTGRSYPHTGFTTSRRRALLGLVHIPRVV